MNFKGKTFGFTLLELLIVITITTILVGIGISSYVSQQRAKLLDTTVQEIVGYLRYAQQKSVAQEGGNQWGVHFENLASGNDFYALYTFDNFCATSSSPIETRYLPAGIEFQTPVQENSIDMSYEKLTGLLCGDSYQQIILQNTEGSIKNVLTCQQGLIAYNRDIGVCGGIDATSPAVSNVTASNISYTTYVDSPFDLSADINETEGGVSSCEYTINDGTNWYSATVGGYGPNYTCTKTGITSSDGTSLTLNMRATSGGGSGTGTSITRTVDTIGPTDGTLTATPDGSQALTSWTAASDLGSGLATSNTYKLVYSTGSSPAANCTTGTQIYLGTGTSYNHTGLTNDETYYYRVCAYDNVSNVSTGATATAIFDTTPPSIGTIVPSNYIYGSYVSSPFTLSVTATDNESSVTSCEYTINGSTWNSADVSGTGPNYTCTKTGITSSDGASLTLNMRATSGGGTDTGTSITRTVDAVAPTALDNWTDNWTTSSPVSITITPSDARSGVASTKYCVDTTNTCTPSTTGTSISVPCASGSTCTQYARYAAWDNVNNTSTYSKRVRQDRQAPTDGTLTATPSGGQVALSWTAASDSGSGLATSNTYKLVYNTGSSPAANCTSGTQIYLGTGTSYNHTDLADGVTYYYRVCAYDNLSNVSTGATASAISDSTPPSIGTIVPSDYTYGSYVSSPFTLSTTATDSDSTVTSCEYTINGSTWNSANLSGSSPTWTCTASGITASNGSALTLNIRAISTGGTGTGTAINKTVDSANPTASDNWTDNWTATSPVTVTITPSDGSGSGISTTKYCVDSPNSCTPSTTGTSVSVTACASVCTQYARYTTWDNVNNTSSTYSKKVRQDSQDPTDGTLTPTAGNQQISLSWTAASDGSGSGLATSNTYKLVYATGGSPGINCTSGTQIYLGTGTSYNHTSLTNGTTYYYRVCAYDVVSNVSTGATTMSIPDNYCDEDNDGYYSNTRQTSCPSGRFRLAQGNDCDDDCVTCYPGSTAYTTSPDGKDQNCIGGVDESDTGYCTACTSNLGSSVIFGYNGSCVLSSSGTYIYTEDAIDTPPSTAECSCNVKTCTYSGESCVRNSLAASKSGSNVSCSAILYYDAYRSSAKTMYYLTCQPVTSCTVTSTETRYY